MSDWNPVTREAKEALEPGGFNWGAFTIGFFIICAGVSLVVASAALLAVAL